MGPLVYFGTIAIIVTLIGLARGYARELGSTMIILVAIFLLLFIEERLNPLLLTARGLFLDDTNGPSEPLFLSLIYQIGFISAVFAGYAGKTIQFTGKPIAPPQGTMLDILIGAINGYLIAGTLWYYQLVYGYPFGALDWNAQLSAVTPLGINAVQLLPQVLLPNPALWMVPIAVLLLLRVRG